MTAFKGKTGEELQRARKAAAERFMAIALSCVPEGWTVTYRRCRGYCKYDSKIIEVPKPVTRKSLCLFLHECAHAHLHGHGTRKPRHVEEFEAEQWAYAKMREHGIAVPRSVTAKGKRYVAYKIEQATKRGAKRIDPAAKRFAKVTK